MEYTIPEGAILTYGGHENGKGTCARELLHLIVCDYHADATPYRLTASIDVFPQLNDCCGWHDDEHRTRVFLEYFSRIMQCKRNNIIDKRIAVALTAIIREHFKANYMRTRPTHVCATYVFSAIKVEALKGADRELLSKKTEEYTRLFLETICTNYGV